ncbi:hypothetical protein K431DRAFT_160314 [Polychaeton citri CBS 116435]|uniref:Uncharacterized protein n=1 Tax=Polychaeton citri CBS 116435 TaxID=1314669 RepID=A0A9P4Q061_9PEZI|nr:hypothetical protein K431DRAFT_160314 [Polychaeton citri CBS 116435]
MHLCRRGAKERSTPESRVEEMSLSFGRPCLDDNHALAVAGVPRKTRQQRLAAQGISHRTVCESLASARWLSILQVQQ